MDVNGIRRLADRFRSRSSRLIAAGVAVLAGIIAWAAWQSGLTREAIRRAEAAEHAAAQAQTDIQEARGQFAKGDNPRKDPAVQRSRHEDPEEIARVKQLYDEIDNLARIQDRVEDESAALRRIAARRARAREKAPAKSAPKAAAPTPSIAPVPPTKPSNPSADAAPPLLFGPAASSSQ